MLAPLVSKINFNSYKRNQVCNSFSRQNNFGVQKADSVSFGNAELAAQKTVLNLVKDIFKELEALKKIDSSPNADALSSLAKDAFKKLGENFETLKQMEMPKSVVKIDDGTHVKSYKIFGSYIFDHEPRVGNGLLNSIEIDASGKNVVISSFVQSKKQIIAKSAKGFLGEDNVITSVKIS